VCTLYRGAGLSMEPAQSESKSSSEGRKPRTVCRSLEEPEVSLCRCEWLSHRIFVGGGQSRTVSQVASGSWSLPLFRCRGLSNRVFTSG
jgi:hypothetical protein